MNGCIQLMTPDISDKAVDARGAIYSFVPKDAIVEFCYITTRAGSLVDIIIIKSLMNTSCWLMVKEFILNPLKTAQLEKLSWEPGKPFICLN